MTRSAIAACAMTLLAMALPIPADAQTFTTTLFDPCQKRSTPFRWNQEGCFAYSATEGLYGSAEYELLNGFNREGVKKCRTYIQLVSSYGSDSGVLPWSDCLASVREGGTFRDGPYHWGFGRRACDAYTQYTWMVVWTGVQRYDARPQAVARRVVIPRADGTSCP